MNKLKKSSSLKYRADIDGLRAIAILFVVFFHFCGFTGGFIGVDIFFVISGFLISTIIFNGLDSGSFSFIDFYSRRIKRIFPALLLVLTFSIIFGWFVLFPIEYKLLNKHIFRASYFVSNFNLLKESSDYFNNASDNKPLLHLWSLAVEEQFYIIWPLLMWLAWKFRLNVVKIAIFIAIGSFTFGLYKVFHNKAAAFYLPQSRFWELLIGSILVHVNNRKEVFLDWFKKTLNVAEAKILNLLSLLGFILIGISVFILAREKYFPGAWALLPTFGAALIIFAGSSAWFNRVILQNSILVWFGLISFPLYLWHWPLLSFAKIIQNDAPIVFIKILIFLASIILAWLTYRFVEKPIRFGNKPKKKILYLCIFMLLLGVISNDLYRNERLNVYQKNSWDLVRTDRLKPDESCNIFGINSKNIICSTNSDKPEILIVGDSHATSLNSSVYEKKVNLKTLLLSANSCLPFDKYLAQKEFKHDDCRNLTTQIKFAVKEVSSIKTIIIMTYSPEEEDFEKYGFNNSTKKNESKDLFLKGYSDFIAELISAGKNVVFVVDVPKLSHDPKLCVTRIFNKNPASDCKIGKNLVFEKEASYRKIVKDLKKINPKLNLFYSSDVFCDENYCYGKDSNNIFYYDQHHLSVAGSKKLLDSLSLK
ncbi:MAG: acyltransferase [Proteobacteria bacterium]|nr:acyltransferase [Pseudomonadota bacterium]